jgi:hypothetical protein
MMSTRKDKARITDPDAKLPHGVQLLEQFEPQKLDLPISQESLTTSDRAGFCFASVVYCGYRIEDGILRAREPKQPRRRKRVPKKVRRVFAPASEVRLLPELARVYEGKITPEDFASEFGLLGHSHICKPEQRCGGDPVRWFRSHAKNVFDTLNLLEAINRKDVVVIGNFLRRLPRFFATTAWPSNPIRAAREAVVMMVNPQIEGVRRQLQVGTDGIRSVLQPRALIDVVYWQLANASEGVPTIRRCLECESFFIGGDPRRMYCPGKNCGMQRRVKRFRERQKKEKTS